MQGTYPVDCECSGDCAESKVEDARLALRREPWPEDDVRFMRERGDGTFSDTGQDITVWLYRADGFRWAADMAIQYADLDESARGQESSSRVQGADSLESSLALSDQAVERAFAGVSDALGPINWFGLTCAVGALYRHYVELLLKVVIILGYRIQHRNSPFPWTHDLTGLWDLARSTMLGIWPNRDEGGKEVLERATEHVTWLADIDPNGESFRYPSDEGLLRDEALPLIEELQAHVIPLGNYLRSVAVGMWDVRGEQQNQEEDMRKNLPDSDPGI